MKKFTITKDNCRMPVIDMATGHVIANSFAPYFDQKTLSLGFLALCDAAGTETMYLPFSSLCFLNDICTMVSLPAEGYIPDSDGCCKLIGMPLTAKAGTVSLFNFGKIDKADVAEGGDVISLTLHDGHSFLVPREDTPENASVNDVFATEAFNCSNASLRVTPSAQPAEKAAAPAPAVAPAAPAPEKQQAPRPFLRSEAIARTAAVETPVQPEKKTAPEWKEVRQAAPERPVLPDLQGVKIGEPAAPAAAPAASEPEETKEEEAPAQKAPEKERFKFQKFVAPIVAMLIFFVLYCAVSMLFIQG